MLCPCGGAGYFEGKVISQQKEKKNEFCDMEYSVFFSPFFFGGGGGDSGRCKAIST